MTGNAILTVNEDGAVTLHTSDTTDYVRVNRKVLQRLVDRANRANKFAKAVDKVVSGITVGGTIELIEDALDAYYRE